ncbi:Uncharacterized protein Rs2_51460 [Raphanus sativus]|nr:Uncharacterized protein Rs2_51460 [Raphanus sativus]
MKKHMQRKDRRFGRRVCVRATAGSLSFQLLRSVCAPPSPSGHRAPCPISGSASTLVGGSALGVTTRQVEGSRWRGSVFASSAVVSRGTEAYLDPSASGCCGRWRLAQLHRRRLRFPGRGVSIVSAFAGFVHGGWKLTKFRTAV